MTTFRSWWSRQWRLHGKEIGYTILLLLGTVAAVGFIVWVVWLTEGDQKETVSESYSIVEEHCDPETLEAFQLIHPDATSEIKAQARQQALQCLDPQNEIEIVGEEE